MKNITLHSHRKLPAVDAGKCNKCAHCIEVCPVQAIAESSNNCCAKCIKYCMTMEVPCSPEYVVFDYEKCDSCGLCVASCPHGAILWVVPKTIL
ncbi:MAG: 4Fe-4S binding protein [Spirochaetes bacterium]|nr:4Fe-4S binding protein [Spirochaetota bacterium]